MLKTVSSITNAIGALNYKGTWNASTNSPALASGVGTKGDYYVVSVAGSTNLDGETLWGVGDWAVYNGAAWQKVEGGNTINATTVSASTSVTTPIVQSSTSAGTTLKNASGTTCIQYGAGGGTNVTIEAAINMNGANAHIEMSPTGTGHVTIKPTAVGDMDNMIIGATTPLAGGFTTVKAATTIGVGAATPSASGAGITFPATQSASTDANTLDDYEEGTWTPVIAGSSSAGVATGGTRTGTYTKIGNRVTFTVAATWTSHTGVGQITVTGYPFSSAQNTPISISTWGTGLTLAAGLVQAYMNAGTTSGTAQTSTTGAFSSVVVTGTTNMNYYVSGTYNI